MMKYSLIALILLLSCAKVDVVKSPDNIIEWHSFTVLKDISVDPNGVVSTTSTSADSIIGSIVGFLTAWIIK